MWRQPLSEEARQKKWEEFLADLENSPDPHVENYQVADYLQHKGRTLKTNKRKANAFIKEYSADNRQIFTNEYRNRMTPMKHESASQTLVKSQDGKKWHFCFSLFKSMPLSIDNIEMLHQIALQRRLSTFVDCSKVYWSSTHTLQPKWITDVFV